jgi:hypothetical protein
MSKQLTRILDINRQLLDPPVISSVIKGGPSFEVITSYVQNDQLQSEK